MLTSTALAAYIVLRLADANGWFAVPWGLSAGLVALLVLGVLGHVIGRISMS